MISSDKITSFSTIAAIPCGNKVMQFDKPLVMGILNITSDSFYDGGNYLNEDAWMAQTNRMIDEGADIIDIGAISSRPGAELISEDVELTQLIPVLRKLVLTFPDTIFSVDTFRAKVVKEAKSAGAHIINDISGGNMDAEMLNAVAESGLPYVLMHMQGIPATMQKNPDYSDILINISDFFNDKIQELNARGIQSIILDPGFGFGKTIENNYTLLQNLDIFKTFGYPVLVGISRKSMIYKPLKTTPSQVLHATSALHFQAILNGADVLRVHDVKEAKQVIEVAKMYMNS